MTPLESAQARLAMYLEAEAKILQAQEYTVGQGSTARRLARADLAEVRDQITQLQREVAALQPTGSRPRRVMYLRPY